MPEGKIIPATAQEYSELEGLPEGSHIKFEGEGTLTAKGIMVESMSLDTEDTATRELNKMAGKESSYSGGAPASRSF